MTPSGFIFTIRLNHRFTESGGNVNTLCDESDDGKKSTGSAKLLIYVTYMLPEESICMILFSTSLFYNDKDYALFKRVFY